MKAASASDFGGAITGEMAAAALDKTRGIAVWAEKTSPVVFSGGVADWTECGTSPSYSSKLPE